MKRILVGILSAMVCMPFHGQTDDPVVMTVNGYDVSKSEFEYFFNKNRNDEPVNRKTLSQYADLYLNFKLKVQAAQDEGMDKSESFLEEYKGYRDLLAEDYLIDKDYLESIARQTYDRTLIQIGSDGLADISVISATPDESEGETIDDCIGLLQSVRKMLDEGADFAELARQYSRDAVASRGGAFGQVARNDVPEEVGDRVFEMIPGQYSEVFESDGTAFLVKVNDRRIMGSFESERDDIYRWIGTQKDILADARHRKANNYATRLGWTVRDDEACAHLDSVLEEVEPEFKNISREYHDGLLVFDISNREVWQKAADSPEELEAYYKANTGKFKFKEPCFKGMVFFCIDEDAFHEVEKLVDGLDVSGWLGPILDYNNDTIKVRIMRGASETGLFFKGQNPYVDKIVFGEGEYEPMVNFPYVNVIGRKIKQPESIRDVAGQVADEYQAYLEQQWVKQLRKKYKYKINRKVLNKVSLESE